MVSAENLSNGDIQDHAAAVSAKYEEERLKRLREDGVAQYVELEQTASSKLQALTQDPWVDHEALNKLEPNLKDGDNIKILILGTGWASLLVATRLIEAGMKPEDLRLVDTAGGFGGTWYWNRYPGIMCDVESSIYMPLLEETGYIPKNRFSYGAELREHAERIAEKWNFADKAVFRTMVHSYVWDEASYRWIISLTQNRGPNEPAIDMNVKAQFTILANGLFNHAKAPGIQGVDSFEGEMLHTNRWNYGITGGSPTDPTLSKLKDKRVAIIGTGATAIQVVPHLGKWSKQLYVFQRTASSVEVRGQRTYDAESWNEIANKKGWWKERSTGWIKAISGYPDFEKSSKVRDGWYEILGYRHLSGGPHTKPWTKEDIPRLVEDTVKQDITRAERLRRRVEEIVSNKETAQNLKAWYPAWCKRPCFHDDYLPTFNRPNVKLVDTDGKGVERITRNSLVYNGVEYEVDVLIFGTGFRTLSSDFGDPSVESNTPVTGREQTMNQKWKNSGARTLHGVLSNSFPNFFLTSSAQSGVSPNHSHTLNIRTTHIAYLLTEALKRAENPDTVTIEPTVEAEEAWSRQILKGSTWFSPMMACGPNYMNGEGAKLSPEDQVKTAYGSPYSQGPIAFEELLEDWRVEGSMEGIVIKS